MNIYWIVLMITTGLAMLFRNQRTKMIVSIAVLHVFVCGFRYQYMHGDLLKYHAEFLELKKYGWFSPEIIREGRNTLFYMLNKLISVLFNDNFQLLLFIISLISVVAISIVIYRYSPNPYISFLVWNCFGFYIFTFYSIKQALAMAVVMMASTAVFQNRRGRFYVLIVLAGLIHFPAFIFLPAYELCQLQELKSIVIVYLVAFTGVFLYRNQIVVEMAEIYYETNDFMEIGFGVVGGKAIFMLLLIMAGYVMCGFSETVSRKTFLLIFTATLLQLFSVYDNVFTRLADYYFQFVILFAAQMLSQVHLKGIIPMFYFNERSRKLLLCCFLAFCIWFYNYTTIKNIGTMSSTDNLITNFAFMWQR